MAGSSRPHGNRDALLTAVAAVAVVVAGAVSPRVDVHLPAGVWEARAQALALEASGATALWMRAVPTFGQAIVDQARHNVPLETSLRPVADDIMAATRLDPGFDQAWLGGYLMLHVLDGGGPHAGALALAGRATRPDLPWELLDREGRP